jgi:uncharacterized zinc-type alcohol dehydrogenase-like protein
MTLRTAALVSTAKGAVPAPGTVELREVREDDVLIDVHFCGVCHSDIHQVNSGWGESIYPMVPGHEVTGVVVATGVAVTGFSPGDRVGIGVFVDSCGTCEYCAAGQEQYCLNGPIGTYHDRGYDGAPTYGGYARRIIARESFVYRIPDELPLDAAAPLLCAGITVYSPLSHWGVGPGSRVAVIGMGGLGHLAVKFADALGAHVTVLTHSASKHDDAIAFGADEVHAIATPADLRPLRNRFDFIVNTVSENLDLDAYAATLRVGGTLCTVGLPEQPAQFGPFALVGGRRSFAGSSVGSRLETEAMLALCVAHGITATIERAPATALADTYARVVASQVRYRAVLDIAGTLPE